MRDLDVPSLHVTSPGGKGGVMLVTHVDGSPSLSLWDKHGHVHVSLTALGDGSPRLILSDKKGLNHNLDKRTIGAFPCVHRVVHDAWNR